MNKDNKYIKQGHEFWNGKTEEQKRIWKEEQDKIDAYHKTTVGIIEEGLLDTFNSSRNLLEALQHQKEKLYQDLRNTSDMNSYMEMIQDIQDQLKQIHILILTARDEKQQDRFERDYYDGINDNDPERIASGVDEDQDIDNEGWTLLE